MEPKQWEGCMVEGRFLLRQYLGGSPHSAVFGTEFGDAAPRKAAIKLVPADPVQVNGWVLGRELAAGLSHPGLLCIYQFGSCHIDDSVCAYAAMEPSDEDLSQVIPTRPLTAAEARELLLGVVEILAYLHERGFVHGRLTPSNIMAAGDRIKISSDCLARVGQPGGNLWVPDANDPPESRTGMTPAGDVWWLGITLVEALTQRAPAWDRTRPEDPVVPETMAAPFRDIARRCLRWDPRMRCSLAEISLALQPKRPAQPPRPRAAAAVAAPKPSPRKRRYLLPVAGAVLAGVVVTVAILTGLRSGSPSPGAESSPPAAVGAADPGTPQAAPAARGAAPGDSAVPTPETAEAKPAVGGEAEGTGATQAVGGETVASGGGARPGGPAPTPAASEAAPPGSSAATPVAGETAPAAGGGKTPGSSTPARVAAEVAGPQGRGKTPGSSAATPVAAETVPPQGGGKTPGRPQVPPVAGETAPAAGGGKMPGSSTPARAAAESAPAAGGGNSSGDVLARLVPDVPQVYLTTIHGSFAVIVRVKVDGSGAVVDAALDSRPGSRYFDRISVDAARRWRFRSSGDGQGREAQRTRLVRFEYRREGCSASSSGAPR